MREPNLAPRTLAWVGGVAAAVIVLVILVAATLVRHWGIGSASDTPSAAAIVSHIPPPRLQTAPQAQEPPAPAAAHGSATAIPARSAHPTPAFEQRLGNTLPPDLRLIDAQGQTIDRRLFIDSRRATVLLPAYFRCATLCGTVAHGALEALADTGLPTGAWQLVVFSIDPQDTPADANALRSVYERYARWARPAVYERPGGVPIRLLTGSAAQTRALATAIGFDWVDPGQASSGFPAHATGLVVVDPQARVSHYLFGVRFDPERLRAALVDAADGRVGSPVERLLLACSHLDPSAGVHEAAVLWLVRAVGAGCVVAFGFWAWRHRRPPTFRRPG